MQKTLMFVTAFFGLIALEYFLHFPVWTYKNGGGQIDSWSCRGVVVKLSCKSFYPALLPDSCSYLCLGKSIHKSVNATVNDLDFYKKGNGFLDIFK